MAIFQATTTAAPAAAPSQAEFQGVEGIVVVDGTIDKNGHMKNLTLLDGPVLLRESALAAVRQWVFNPPVRDGEAVEMEIEVEVVFQLKQPGGS